MSRIGRALLSMGLALGMVTQVLAHGDESLPKCKKGYVPTDEHKCVKAPS